MKSNACPKTHLRGDEWRNETEAITSDAKGKEVALIWIWYGNHHRCMYSKVIRDQTVSPTVLDWWGSCVSCNRMKKCRWIFSWDQQTSSRCSLLSSMYVCLCAYIHVTSGERGNMKAASLSASIALERWIVMDFIYLKSFLGLILQSAIPSFVNNWCIGLSALMPDRSMAI